MTQEEREWCEEDRLEALRQLDELESELAGVEFPLITDTYSKIPPEIVHFASDQVVVVRGKVMLGHLQAALAEAGQCIPHGNDFADLADLHRSPMAGVLPALAYKFPHVLEAQCGSWRDWVLGMTVVLADGTVAKGGSQAVKNVAGYDVHKLFIGDRSTLGIACEVILRTFPISAIPKAEVEVGPTGRQWLDNPSENPRWPKWIQRTKPSDFAAAVRSAGDRLLCADHASSTLWAIVPPEETLDRFPDDWILRAYCDAKNLEFADPTQIRLMKRTKDIFDPTHKLNPGEMGIF
jgi:hypothetical protein